MCLCAGLIKAWGPLITSCKAVCLLRMQGSDAVRARISCARVVCVAPCRILLLLLHTWTVCAHTGDACCSEHWHCHSMLFAALTRMAPPLSVAVAVVVLELVCLLSIKQHAMEYVWHAIEQHRQQSKKQCQGLCLSPSLLLAIVDADVQSLIN